MTIAFVHGVPETAAIWDLIGAEFKNPPLPYPPLALERRCPMTSTSRPTAT